MKASYVIQEVLDERGRYISPYEFRWLLNSFKDRYDPRRLAFALCYVTGLRPHDGILARLKWFSNEFREMKMSQCKPKVSRNDGVMHIKNKPRFVPIPEWLATDLRNYIQYRIMMAWYVGEGLEDFRLFPKLNKSCLIEWMGKLRYGHKEDNNLRWLYDVWQVIKFYDKDGNLVRTRKMYRIAPHACRANYVTCCYESTGNDLAATKVLSGHEETKDLERYIKVSGIMEKKFEVKEKYMDNLMPEQKIPLLIGQTKLSEY